ncbi:hypothetical protein B0T18DRAFT_407587 [Schizothecium vesticola]|uniref:SUEL-type lectin domain-containing protein n=1 Tax=Schizothecium vesticola TaxID=314040 RepID=A0AA40F233_9PEZI|nr:hypothetical protein B0T18DRAFT_407587 [Schizothecium vesticola]
MARRCQSHRGLLFSIQAFVSLVGLGALPGTNEDLHGCRGRSECTARVYVLPTSNTPKVNSIPIVYLERRCRVAESCKKKK